MILKFPLVHKVHNLRRLLDLTSLQDRQVRQVFRQDGLQFHHQHVVQKEVKREIPRVSDLHPHPRPSPPEPPLISIPMSDGEIHDDHHPERGKDNGLDRVSEYIRTYQCRRNRKFNPFLLQNQMIRYQMRILRLLIPHHHQRDHNHQLNMGFAPEEPKDPDHVSEYIHGHPNMPVNSNSLLYLLLREYSSIRHLRVMMKIQQPWIHRIGWVIIQSHRKIKKTHGDKVHKHRKERKILPKSSRAHRKRPRNISSWYSDEDDERPQNVPGTSSEGRPAARSQEPAASAYSGDEDSEYSDEYSAQSHDSGRTVPYPDLYVVTNDDHPTMTPKTRKYAAAAGSFWFVTTENGDQQDICNLTAMPCVQRSLYLKEMTNNFSNIQSWSSKRSWRPNSRCVGTMYDDLRKGSRNQSKKEISCTKGSLSQRSKRILQSAEAKHLEYKSWVDNEVFDLVDLRKVKPRSYVIGRWVLTIKTDKQGNFLKAKERWVMRGFQDEQTEYQQTDSLLPQGLDFGWVAKWKQQELEHFHIDLETAFLQRQSYCVNRDVVCQLPPEAGRPSYIAASLKKRAYGMNDVSRRWWNVLAQSTS